QPMTYRSTSSRRSRKTFRSNCSAWAGCHTGMPMSTASRCCCQHFSQIIAPIPGRDVIVRLGPLVYYGKQKALINRGNFMSSATIMTIERHILEQQKLHPHATGAFTGLLQDVALAAKLIARQTTRAGLLDILGAAEGENIYGERQQKLDLFANRIIFQINDHTGRLCAM